MPKKTPKTFVNKPSAFNCSFYGVYAVHKILSSKVLVAFARKDQTAFSDSRWDLIVQRKRESEPSADLGVKMEQQSCGALGAASKVWSPSLLNYGEILRTVWHLLRGVCHREGEGSRESQDGLGWRDLLKVMRTSPAVGRGSSSPSCP